MPLILLSEELLNSSIVVTVSIGVGVAAYFAIRTLKRRSGGSPMNLSIRKHEKKVVDALDIEDLLTSVKPGEKVSFCRCWRSKTWPYCDGAHGAFNRSTGDNTGPLKLTRKAKTSS